MIPWFLVSVVDFFAWHLGYQVYVTAQGGPGWHRGRFGADKVHLIRHPVGEPRPRKLKKASW